MKLPVKPMKLIHKVIHRMMQWPSKITHQAYSIGPIRSRRQNERVSRVQAHCPHLPILTAEEAHLAGNLAADGFCVTRSEIFESIGSENLFTAAKDIFDSMEDHYYRTGTTIDIIRLLRVKPSLLHQFKVIFRAGLDIKVLRIVEHYLQLPVGYGGVDIFFTIADGVERGARSWHRDSEDNPMVKVAVYFNDVGENDGPLEILHLQHMSTKTRKARSFRQKNLVQLQKNGIIKFHINSFTGATGTVILCDTFKHLHRGKPSLGQNRRALFFNYYTQKPMMPYFCPNPPFSVDMMRELTSDLSPKQIDSALWRENLSTIEKMVTKRKQYLSL